MRWLAVGLHDFYMKLYSRLKIELQKDAETLEDLEAARAKYTCW